MLNRAVMVGVLFAASTVAADNRTRRYLGLADARRGSIAALYDYWSPLIPALAASAPSRWRSELIKAAKSATDPAAGSMPLSPSFA